MTMTMTKPVTITRDALHLLHVDNSNVLFDERGVRFDVEAYSRFKYGQADTGRAYGLQLAQLLATKYRDLALSEDKIVVMGPSYKFLSTASHGAVRMFCIALNTFRVRNGFDPAYELHSIRSTVGSDSYAMGDAALRATHLAKSKYHVDTAMIKGAHVIFIDDVNITGSTEQRSIDRTIPCEPLDMLCLHVAIVDPDYAASNAAIENTMNKTIPLSLGTVACLIGKDNFRLNTRVFRSIMEWKDQVQLEAFFVGLDDSWLLTMYEALVSGTVEMYNRFPEATHTLESVLRIRNILPEVL